MLCTAKVTSLVEGGGCSLISVRSPDYMETAEDYLCIYICMYCGELLRVSHCTLFTLHLSQTHPFKGLLSSVQMCDRLNVGLLVKGLMVFNAHGWWRE